MKTRVAIALLVGGTLAFPVFAQGTPNPGTNHPAPGVLNAAELTSGEVRKVDKEAGKITLRHEAMPSLDMPPMTMVFRVSDPKLLDHVKAGDKVRFNAEKVGGLFTVTQLELAP